MHLRASMSLRKSDHRILSYERASTLKCGGVQLAGGDRLLGQVPTRYHRPSFKNLIGTLGGRRIGFKQRQDTLTTLLTVVEAPRGGSAKRAPV